MIKKNIILYVVFTVSFYLIFSFVCYDLVFAQTQCPTSKEIDEQIAKCKNSGLDYSIEYDEKQCKYVKCIEYNLQENSLFNIGKNIPKIDNLKPLIGTEKIYEEKLEESSNTENKESITEESQKEEIEESKPVEKLIQESQENDSETTPEIRKLSIKEGKVFINDKEVQMNEVKINLMGKEIIIRLKENSLVEIYDQGLSVEVNIPIEYSDGVLRSGKSGKEIKFIPSQIVKKIKEILISQIRGIKIAEDQKFGLIYNVLIEKKGKFLGLISLRYNKEYKISTEDASIRNVKSPWWIFLVVKEADPVRVDLQCPPTDSYSISWPDEPYDFSRGDCASLGKEEEIEEYIRQLTAKAQDCLDSIDDNIRRWNEQKEAIINYLRNAPQYPSPEPSTDSNSRGLYLMPAEEAVPGLPLFSGCGYIENQLEADGETVDGFAYTSLLEKMKEAVSETCESANVLNEDLVCLCEDVADYINGQERLLPEHKEDIISLFENRQINESVVRRKAKFTFDWLNYLIDSWHSTYNPEYVSCSLKLKLPRSVVKNIEEAIKFPEKQILP